MMHKRNLVPFIIIIILLLIILLFVILFSVALARNARVSAEITSKYKTIDSYAKKSKMPISKESISLLIDERNKLKGVYSRLKLAYLSPLNEKVLDEELDPLQFKERLIQTQKKLREDAAMHNLSLPQSLGFAKYETELSKPSEIPILIGRLKVLEEIIHIVALSNVESLNKVYFAEKELKKEKKEEAYFDIPVSITIDCTSSKFLDCLYKLRLSAFAFIVEDLDVVRIEDAGDKDEAAEGKLRADLEIKAVALN